ncbi:MAG: DUF2087 domain-containing protein [Eubacteriaceae bacterium]|nr:DUF2087 domain-containing protein [Eubacteriaceae bacterium]
MDYLNLAIESIANGYYFDDAGQTIKCIYCTEEYHNNQAYAFGDELLMHERAAQRHIAEVHHGSLENLLSDTSKYNSLTDNQKELIRLLAKGLSDNDIAKSLSRSPSTVRSQKFALREKAKQAKFFLAVYELAFASKAESGDELVSFPNSATYNDDRFIVTEKEKEHILATFFESLEPLKLKALSPKEKNKAVTLARIAEEFEKGKKYSYKEVTQILKGIFYDHTTIRRYLIEYGFMQRVDDGSTYWLS